ncbi:MAG: PAS domain S-box protein [Desulfatiglandaceae bacterium]
MTGKPTYEKLEQRVRVLGKAESELKKAREQEAHIRKVLLAIRNVNQLIVKETDPGQLIKRACASLTETRGYFNAWIALMDEAGSSVTMTASSGFNGGFNSMKSHLLHGEFPSCMRETLGEDKLVVTRKPTKDCHDCPLSSEYAGRAGLSRRLSHAGKLYGILSVSVPKAYANDVEEHDLFTEVTGDLGLGLHKMETEEQAHRLNRIVTSIPQPMSLVSPQYQYLAVNDAYAELYSTSPENVIGHTPADFLGEHVFETEIKPHLDQALNGRQLRYEMEQVFTCKGPRWMAMSYFPYRDKRGDIKGVISHGDDVTENKKVEIELKEKAQLLQDIFDNMFDLVSLTDLEGNYKFVGASHKVLNYDLDSLIGRNVLEFVHPEDLPEISSVFGDFLSKLDDNRKVEYRYRCADGSYVWFETVGNFIRDASGNPREILFSTRDVTNRKLAEEALRESEEKHRRLFDTMAQGVIYQAADGAIISANPAAERILGLSFDQMRGKTSIDPRWKMIRENGSAVPGTEHPAMIALRTGQTIGPVTRGVFHPEKNTHVWLSIIAIPLFRPGETAPFQVYATLEDITGRKQQEEALRESERRFQKMLGVVPDMISIHSPEMDILYSNWQGFAAVPAAKQIPNTKCYKTYRGFDKICPDCQAGAVLESRKPIQKEVLLPDGTWVDLRAIPLLDEANNVEMFMEWVRDITERKRAEAEREKLQSQLTQAQKLESVGRLAGGVAHDFNNMLGVIIGFTELAMEKAAPEDPLQEDLKEVFDSARRSTDITRQLLAFARQQTISPKVIDLNETVEAMLKMLRRLIGEDIDLSWQPGPGRMPVFLDPSQLDQLLANLCVNARDAIDGVGNLTIETDHVCFDAEYCADHAEFAPGDFILLAVSDDGAGMDKETLDNIFEPFFTTKGVGEGTGLGLSTVFGIVKQNDGFINVYSEPDKGTTFKIYLPLCAGEDTGLNLQETTEIPGGHGETVLIVEDEASVLKLAQRILERSDYTVLTAATPGEAMSLAEEHGGEIQLVITDVVMPEMNGRDLAEQLKAYYPALKVLFMSGYTANVIAHRGILDEGVHFIQKPFSNRELGQKVREALES